MNWLVLVAIMELVLVAAVGVGLLYREWKREDRQTEQADHAKCIAHIADVTSHRVVAQAFRTAADRWDSAEEQGELKRLANERYTLGGPSMPAIWLREQAARLERGDD